MPMMETRETRLNETDQQMLDSVVADIKGAFESGDKKRIKKTIRGLELFAFYMRLEMIFKRKDGGNESRTKLIESIKGLKKDFKDKGML